jgi:hypothetical protein
MCSPAHTPLVFFLAHVWKAYGHVGLPACGQEAPPQPSHCSHTLIMWDDDNMQNVSPSDGSSPLEEDHPSIGDEQVSHVLNGFPTAS